MTHINNMIATHNNFICSYFNVEFNSWVVKDLVAVMVKGLIAGWVVKDLIAVMVKGLIAGWSRV